MSPSRRPRPGAQPPARRPKVAGTRGSTRPDTGESSDAPTTEEGSPESEAENRTAEQADPENTGGLGDTGDNGDTEDTGQRVAHGSEDDTADSDTAPGDDTAVASGRAPRPSPKPRDVGTPKPTGEDEVAASTPETSTPETSTRPEARSDDGRDPAEGPGRPGLRKAGYPVAVALLVCAVAFSAVAVLFAQRYSDAAATTDNAALVDVAATAEVKQTVSDAAERLFSLDHNNLEQNRKAADELLINGDVRNTYEAMMRDVRQKAPEQKIVVTTTVVRSAVVRLQEDSARVLVYLDQSATRTENEQTSAAGSAMWFRAEQRDGTWKIADMDTYSAGQSMDPESGGSGPSQPGEQSRPGDAGTGQDGDSPQQQPSDQQEQDGQGSADSNGGATEGN